jgi:hypothetical protein
MCIIPSAFIVCFLICILIVLSHMYTCIILRGGDTTPPFVADAFFPSVSRSAGYARDVEVLMRSTVSTCPRVGARCYPRFLGITRRSCLEAHRS